MSCRFWIIACIVLWSTSGSAAQKTTDLEQSELTRVEDLSESLANALLDFSVAARRRDVSALRRSISPEVEAVLFPPFMPDKRVKWFSYGTLDLSQSEPRILKRQAFLDEWETALDRFSEIEDIRFKVVDAGFNQESTGRVARSQIKFFLVGRDVAGRRFWIKGDGQLRARQLPENRWEISRLKFEQVDVMRAEVDLFSEIGLPAGVSVSLPPYRSPGNNDFVYHGAAAGDANRDGLVDVMVTGIYSSYLYLNQGDGTFRDAARDWGLPPAPHATAPLWIDYDNDGDLDLFLAAVGDQMLFENRLVPDDMPLLLDVSLEAGVALPAMGFSATAGDVNGDGWPDLYVASYNRYGRIMPNSWHRATNGTANLLFINQKNGSFKESGQAWGVRDRRWSYAAQFADLDGDGKLDLYVANDFGENALYVNRGDRFEETAEASGVMDPGNGMGVSVGDYDNDGRLDLFVTNMSSMAGNRILGRLFPDARPDDNVLRKLAAGNSIFKGKGDGTFTNVSEEAGDLAAGWAWGGVFIDFDNDGWQDLYSPNGFISGESMKDT